MGTTWSKLELFRAILNTRPIDHFFKAWVRVSLNSKSQAWEIFVKLKVFQNQTRQNIFLKINVSLLFPILILADFIPSHILILTKNSNAMT